MKQYIHNKIQRERAEFDRLVQHANEVISRAREAEKEADRLLAEAEKKLFGHG